MVCLQWRNHLWNAFFFLSIIITIVIFVLDKPHYYEYLKDKSKTPHSCDDFIYGCCDYYTDCTLVGDNETSTIYTHPINISWEAKVKHDSKGENCDRLNKILMDYNTVTTKHMSREELLDQVDFCETVSGFCCEVNYVCDERYWWDYIYFGHPQNDYYLIQKSTSNITLYSDQLFNIYGPVCPSIQEIQTVYENILIKDNNYYKVYIVIILCITTSTICFTVIKELNQRCAKKNEPIEEHKVLRASA